MFSLKGLLGGPSGLVPKISPREAKAMLDRGEAIVIDVREEAEVARSGRVPGAITIPHRMVAAYANGNAPMRGPKLDRSKAIIAYCASGARSAHAGQILKQMGFETVYNLGGFREWAAAGLPLER